MRRLERNFDRKSDVREAAIKIRERFMDKPAEWEELLPWSWPRRMKEVGEWGPGEGAIMYTSEKWQKRADKFIDYKHVAEGRQRLLVTPGFLRDYHQPSQKLRVGGPMVELNGPMPDTFAKLAPILGIQAQLYEGNERDYRVNPDDAYNITIADANLGAAIHPKTKKPFLFIYDDDDGVFCIITGSELDVLEDGIVG